MLRVIQCNPEQNYTALSTEVIRSGCKSRILRMATGRAEISNVCRIWEIPKAKGNFYKEPLLFF